VTARLADGKSVVRVALCFSSVLSLPSIVCPNGETKAGYDAIAVLNALFDPFSISQKPLMF